MSSEWKEEANYVPVVKAREQAVMHGLREVVQKAPGLDIWRSARVYGRPLRIFDLNGKVLFYEFPVVRKRQMVGRIRASASKVLGSPIYSLQAGPRKWNLRKAIVQTTDLAKRMYRGANVLSTRLVCYCYPKLGILVRLRDSAGKARRVIIDVADYHVETEKPPQAGVEGTGAYSLYDSIPMAKRKSRVERWEKSTSDMETARDKSGFDVKKAFTSTRIDAASTKIVAVALDFFKIGSRVVTFCPHRGPHSHPTATGLSIFPFFGIPHCFELHGQQTSYYCAVATGQMILDFWRYYFDQKNDIAAAMGTTSGGTYNSGQVNGYESLTNNQLDATYDTSANWTEARNEINENRPVKSGTPGHARACVGWKMWGPERWLYIYDPSPPDPSGDGGQIYWENWDAVTHTNFIYVRRA